MRILTLDFETRSACPLKSYRRYAMHQTTGVLCIGLQWHDMTEGRTWAPRGSVAVPGDQCPEEVLIAIEEGYPIFAHNVAFDRTMWEHHCVPCLGWPSILHPQWACTMAVCAYYGLPQGLQKAAAALGLVKQKQTKKDKGKLALSQCCKPRRPRMAEVAEFTEQGLTEFPVLWYEDQQRLQNVRDYCRQDVGVQTELLLKLGPLPPDRLRDWRLDQKINERGVPIDFPNLICAAGLVEKTMGEANVEVRQITGGKVGAVTARDQIMDYLAAQNVFLPSLDKESVEGALDGDGVQGNPRRVLELRQMAGKSSLAKIESMLDHVDPDGRVRHGLAWHGAATGRWAGRGVQWQNFPRDALKTKDAEALFALMEQVGDDLEAISHFGQTLNADPPGLLSKALRAFIRPGRGKSLLIADFAAIECRVLSWLAGCTLLQRAFAKGECPYCQFATRATGREIKKGMPERQLGKVAVLGLGYQMGGPKFQETAMKPPYHIDMSEAKSQAIVDLYRGTYPEVPAFWRKVEDGFVKAVTEQRVVQAGKISIGCRGIWAWIQLPSSRTIWYYDPQVKSVVTPWGQRKAQVSYMSLDMTKRWVRTSTYGGKITENIVQGIAACLLTAAMHRVEDAGIPIIASIHDEVVAECEDAQSRFDEFHRLMEVVPEWATGCFVNAESHVAERYGK